MHGTFEYTRGAQMRVLFLAFVYIVLWSESCYSFIQSNELGYIPPQWPVDNPSITIGTVRSFLNSNTSELALSTGAALTAYCQINLINKGLAGPKIKGNFNYKVYDDKALTQSIQYYTIKLLENSLYNLTTMQPLIAGNDSEKLGVLLHSQAIGNSRAGYGITQDFGIPYLDYGTQGVNGFQNSNLNADVFRSTVLYSLRLTQNFTMANAVFELLDYYNWTLVAGIYAETEYGSYMLSLVQSSGNTINTTFVCNKQTGGILFQENDTFTLDFCSCVDKYDSINVIVIWGNFGFANRIAEAFKAKCSGFDKKLFLVADDSDTIYPEPAMGFNLQNSLWINSQSQSKYPEFLKNCSEAIDGESGKVLFEKLLDSLALVQKGCTFAETRSEGQIQCKGFEIFESNQNDTIASEFFYVADAITTVAEAIYLLQSNCSYLTEQFQTVIAIAPELTNDFLESNNPVPSYDFCTLETFTPAILTSIMRFVNFTGYTGPVSFDYQNLFRIKKPYYVYNFRDSFVDIELVGVIEENVFRLNSSEIIFPNNNATIISEIVPDNPGLGDSVVDVFFGVDIFFALAFTAILFAYIYFRDEPKIRKNSPVLSYMLILGCILISIGLIVASIEKTDVICIVVQYIGYTGIAFLFGALLSKHYRVYRIFSNAKASAVYIPTWKLLLFIFLIWLYFIFLISMSLIDDFGAYTMTSENNPFYTFVICRCKTPFWNTFFRIVLTISKVLIIVAASVMAFLTRKVPSGYSESRQIAIVSYGLLSFGIVLIPLYYIMGDNTDSETFRFVIITIFSAISLATILLVLCLPNLYWIYRDRRLRRD